ncbi:MAG: response regulator receiver [Ignavibacteria bacterium]|nr:MAG: response regulator receiver [Ignavibacteria bacterium]KAF0161902.1 MAG: response regulator receiver [Ignavibacteria bacterium]
MNNKRHTILILEDDEIILDIFTRIFQNEFNVIPCLSIESFYSYLKSSKVNLFLLDMALGSHKNGIDLIKELRNSEEHNNTPIVVVSAHSYIRDEKLALAAGATKYIRKPTENKYLVNEVKKVLENKQF